MVPVCLVGLYVGLSVWLIYLVSRYGYVPPTPHPGFAELNRLRANDNPSAGIPNPSRESRKRSAELSAVSRRANLSCGLILIPLLLATMRGWASLFGSLAYAHPRLQQVPALLLFDHRFGFFL